MKTDVPKNLKKYDGGLEGIDRQKLAKKSYINLASNENLFLPDQEIFKIAKTTLKQIDPRKYPYEEYHELIGRISEKYKVRNEQILLGNGSDQLIDLLIRSCLKIGSPVYSITPTFSMYSFFCGINQMNYHSFPLNKKFDLDLMQIDPVTWSNSSSMFFLCSPNNPTGNKFGNSLISSLCKSFKGIVVIDEAYFEFSLSSCLSLTQKYPNLVILRTFSKSYGLAGMRIGYIIGNPKLMLKLKNYYQLPYPVSSFSLKFASNLMDHPDLLREAQKDLIAEREYFEHELSKMKSIDVFPSCTNFILVNLQKMNSNYILGELRNRGFLVRNIGEVGPYKNCIRITIGPRKVSKPFLENFKEALY